MATYEGAGAIERWSANVFDGRIPKVIRAAAFLIWNGVTDQNPVLTGRSRFGWNMDVDKMDLTVPPPAPNKEPNFYPPPPLPTIGPVVASSTINVTNNVPYILPLETGTSDKAPPNFIRDTVKRVVKGVPDVTGTVRKEGEITAVFK